MVSSFTWRLAPCQLGRWGWAMCLVVRQATLAGSQGPKSSRGVSSGDGGLCLSVCCWHHGQPRAWMGEGRSWWPLLQSANGICRSSCCVLLELVTHTRACVRAHTHTHCPHVLCTRVLLLGPLVHTKGTVPSSRRLALFTTADSSIRSTAICLGLAKIQAAQLNLKFP